MADASESGTQTETPRKRASLMGVIVEFGLATAVALGAGALLAMLLFPPKGRDMAAPASTEAKAQEQDGKSRCPPLDSALVDLPPIVTNLASPTDIWVRMEAALVVECDGVDHPETLAAEVAADELAYLRTLSVSQIEGPIGLENLRQDLTDRASVRTNGKASEFILKTLVLQ